MIGENGTRGYPALSQRCSRTYEYSFGEFRNSADAAADAFMTKRNIGRSSVEACWNDTRSLAREEAVRSRYLNRRLDGGAWQARGKSVTSSGIGITTSRCTRTPLSGSARGTRISIKRCVGAKRRPASITGQAVPVLKCIRLRTISLLNPVEKLRLS